MKTLNAHAKARYFRRQATDVIMSGLCVLAAIIGLIMLGLILYMLFSRGLAGLTLDVFTKSMSSTGTGGGLANAIVGSLIQVGIGSMIGAPLGMMVGVYLSEVGKDSKFAQIVRFVNDILLSAPSVLIGLFVYQIAVSPFQSFSGIAGALALALLAMPVVARTTEDILRLVPQAYRDGAIALGSRENEVVRKVVLPAAFGGILTGILLAVARIAGETAPLIFTSLGNSNWSTDLTKPMASLPIAIYRYAGSPSADLVQLAWTGALLITVGVLLLNVISRMSLAAVKRGQG
ncbi:MAG: phosphate ABC transporter permease PstA [Alphaproteobacteria bacterium]|nr:MAG: phosphate ABC transporter permease PstA [Alphaproteobacteria bacterium]